MIYQLKEEYFDIKKLELVGRIWEDFHSEKIDGKYQRIHDGYYFEYQVNGKIYNTYPVLPRIEIDKLRSDLIVEWKTTKKSKK